MLEILGDPFTLFKSCIQFNTTSTTAIDFCFTSPMALIRLAAKLTYVSDDVVKCKQQSRKASDKAAMKDKNKRTLRKSKLYFSKANTNGCCFFYKIHIRFRCMIQISQIT